MKTVRLKVSGKVQGVFFRVSAKDIADSNLVYGWIRNTQDDQVEALISGEERNVEKFIEWCREGPKRAIVTGVEILNEPLQIFDRFDIIR